MSRVDRILDLIDEGLCDVGKQSSDEHPFHLDSWYPGTMPNYDGSWGECLVGGVAHRHPAPSYLARHVCGPECGDGAHVAGRLSFSERAMDAYAERLAEMVALDAEVVYVQLHTRPRTPDDRAENVVAWSPTTVWVRERCADESD